MFQQFHNLKVLLTGHTGFKGSWLAIWLKQLGADVVGYSLEPPTRPNLFEIAGLKDTLHDIRGDVRDFEKLQTVIEEHRPDCVFHLAAQPIVLHSFEQTKETFDLNAGGTVNLLEAVRNCSSVRAVVVVTTDKCYENKEWIWGYREIDSLGGSDPYSASKAMTELAAASYRASHFNGLKIASARAGNVIGGGDFSPFRIVPDTMKALMAGKTVQVRNPLSVRPWLHVFDPLYGYLQLAAKLLQGENVAEAWNFGPLEHQAKSVRDLVEKALEVWGSGEWVNTGEENPPPEMQMLRLNWDKAANRLGWAPAYSWDEAVTMTAEWFKAFHTDGNDPDRMHAFCLQQLIQFQERKDAVLSHPFERLLSH